MIVNTPEEDEEPQQSQGLISGPGPRRKEKIRNKSMANDNIKQTAK